MKVVLYVVLSVIIMLGVSIAVFADDETDKEQTPTETATESEPKPATEAAPKEEGLTNPRVIMETNYGNITLELFMKDAPLSVDNFLTYVRDAIEGMPKYLKTSTRQAV